ncbi:cbb3-type cytochrome oxidase assembly protein CcoS [Endothiovibrio diazotrophicus]
MDVIYGLIPGMILMGLGMVVVFILAARSGQFDDLEGAAHRILMDDDDHPPGARPSTEATEVADTAEASSDDDGKERAEQR